MIADLGAQVNCRKLGDYPHVKRQAIGTSAFSPQRTCLTGAIKRENLTQSPSRQVQLFASWRLCLRPYLRPEIAEYAEKSRISFSLRAL